jgi:hypothetical protein
VSTPVVASDRDLRTLADIVSKDRADRPAGEGLPPSPLADLMDQIRCDVISFEGCDSRRQETWLLQSLPGRGDDVAEDLTQCTGSTTGLPAVQLSRLDRRPAQHHQDRGFYSARQWHSVGTYCDIYRRRGSSTI